MDTFQTIARRNWPQADITGTGPWAVVVECYPARGVRLYESENECRAARGQSCGHATCHECKHRVFKLQVFRPPTVAREIGYRDKYDRD